MTRFLTTLLALAVISTAIFAQDQASFEKQLEAVKKLGRKKKWAEQLAGLNEMLAEHEGKAYVKARRSDIEEEMRTASFRTQHNADDPKAIFGGEIKSYGRYNAKLKVRYEGKALAKAFKDGVCQLVFEGPFKLEIRGKDYPARGMSVWVGNPQDGSFEAYGGGAILKASKGKTRIRETMLLDRRPPTSNGLIRLKTMVAKRPCVLRKGHSFSFKIKFDKSYVEFRANGKKIGRGKKSKRHFGFFSIEKGFASRITFLEVEGFIDRAWLQGQLDGRRRTLMANFQKTYDAKKSLPAWLYEAEAVNEQRPKFDAKALPGPKVEGLDAEVLRVRKAIQESFKGKKTARAALNAALLAIKDDKLPAITQLWIRGQTKARLGDFEGALVENAQLLEEAPAFDRGRLERAQYYQRLKNLTRCGEILSELRSKYPNDPTLIYEAANLELVSSRNAKGRALLRDAIGRGIADDKILKLDRILVKAEKGPSWTQKFEIKRSTTSCAPT
ncbi:MAG: hypothetical protein V3W41_18395 [Planctomycetota bacterium]